MLEFKNYKFANMSKYFNGFYYINVNFKIQRITQRSKWA